VTLSPSASVAAAVYPVPVWPRVPVADPVDVNDGAVLSVAVTDVPGVDWMLADPGCR
jgi:hypothetical protein